MKNIQRIGIIGKRRSGRKTAAWLLAEILEGLHRSDSKQDIEKDFCYNVDDVIEDPSKARSTNNYMLDSFGGYILDTIKGLFGTLREYPLEDPNWTQTHFINTCTFEVEGEEADGVHISVNDFIIAFADQVMKTSYGKDFWLYSYKHNSIPSNDTKIFWDVKTDSEKEYCEFIINLICPGREKDGGYRKISNTNADFIIDTRGGLKESFSQFYNVALRLLEINFERDIENK